MVNTDPVVPVRPPLRATPRSVVVPPQPQVTSFRQRQVMTSSGVALFVLVTTGFCANVYFVSPGVAGLPFRFIYMVVLLLGLIALSDRTVIRAVLLNRGPLLLTLYLAIVGFILSAVRGEAIAAMTELISVHVQVAVLLTVSTAGTLLLGGRRMAFALGIAVAISLIFSLLQWAGIEGASHARDYLGTLIVQEGDVAQSRERAPGLSYSTIYLAQQCCMVFALAMFFTTRASGAFLAGGLAAPMRRWWTVFMWSVVLLAASTISGNRSPILGTLVFLSLAISARNPRLLFLALPAIIGFYFLIDPIRDALVDSGLRVAQSGDKSEAARGPLWTYGWRLLMANPLGYGLAFDSQLLTSTVPTGDLYVVLDVNYMKNLLQSLPIHNWYLIVANIYGVFILPAIVFTINVIRKNWEVSIGFVPYGVHIFFHNGGPYSGDYLIWVVFGIIIGGLALQGDEQVTSSIGVPQSVMPAHSDNFEPIEVGDPTASLERSTWHRRAADNSSDHR